MCGENVPSFEAGRINRQYAVGIWKFTGFNHFYLVNQEANDQSISLLDIENVFLYMYRYIYSSTLKIEWSAIKFAQIVIFELPAFTGIQ